MNGMCDLSAQVCNHVDVTLGLWNANGCNYVVSIYDELWVLMKINEEEEGTSFMVARSEF